nr:protein IQ-DOMAIN 14-like [Penaeus vannamei]
MLPSSKMFIFISALVGVATALVSINEGPIGELNDNSPVYFPILPEDFKDFGIKLGGGGAPPPIPPPRSSLPKKLDMPSTTSKPTTTPSSAHQRARASEPHSERDGDAAPRPFLPDGFLLLHRGPHERPWNPRALLWREKPRGQGGRGQRAAGAAEADPPRAPPPPLPPLLRRQDARGAGSPRRPAPSARTPRPSPPPHPGRHAPRPSSPPRPRRCSPRRRPRARTRT